MTLVGRLIAQASLTASERSQMLELMQCHYEGVRPDSFAIDLGEKQWVIHVHEATTGRLCGFSTQMVLDVSVGQRRIKALYSGDTIINRKHWGDPSLIRVGGELALSLAQRWPDDELYWFLISQGYKTYRFLPLFFHEFYPRYDRPTPDDALAIIHSLARIKYPDQYESESGVIRAGDTQYCLLEGIADATVDRCRDPHVKFFIDRNPGHARGDELCCVARISHENFTTAAFRVLGRNGQRDSIPTEPSPVDIVVNMLVPVASPKAGSRSLAE